MKGADAPRWLLAAGDRDQAGIAINRFAERSYLTRLLQGERLLTEAVLLDHLAAALQFPWYFGRNWHAFDECFGEIDERAVGSGVALVVMNGEACVDAQRNTLRDLVTSLGYAAAAWAESGSVDDFVVVVQIQTRTLAAGRAAWEKAGVTFDEFAIS